MITDRFDLDGSVIAFGNGRVGLGVLSTRLFVDVSTRVGLFPSSRNNSDAIRNVWLEFSELYLAFAFNEELHAAHDVTKAHSSKLETFESPDKGPVAVFTRDDAQLFREPRSYSVSLPALRPNKTVSIAPFGQGMDDRQIRFTIEQGDDGLVLDGFGLGNTSETLSDAVQDAVDSGMSVVVTSRTHAGTLNAIYGNGGGQTLQDHGALSGEDLPAHKARTKLLMALEATNSMTKLRKYFGSW